MIIADEVGMGKTRIAAVVARAVTEAGGRVAILVPPGLGYQWQEELRHVGFDSNPPILRNIKDYDEKRKNNILLFSHYFRVGGHEFAPRVSSLLIIDEAHKSREKNSCLNTLIAALSRKAADSRRLALTATPIELDAGQWKQILERIRVEASEQFSATVSDYMRAVAAVRLHPGERTQQEEFRQAAQAFHDALGPYLLRRDKRQENVIRTFARLSHKDFHAYRREKNIRINIADLSLAWKQAICAAESLSFVAHHTDNRQMKRLRLTLANGHGIASLLEQSQYDQIADHAQIEAERKGAKAEEPLPFEKEEQAVRLKREQRVDWWYRLSQLPFDNRRTALFEHPAILAAVKYIEQICRQGEKVLVFGRFTRPLRALTQLLNAREMLRCLDEKRPWPQASLSKAADGQVDMWTVVRIADEQLHKGIRQWTSKDQLNASLEDQYKQHKNARSQLRDKFYSFLAKGSSAVDFSPAAQRVFSVLSKEAQHGEDSPKIQAIFNGIKEVIGTDKPDLVRVAQAFVALVDASSGRGGQGYKIRTVDILEKLQNEYSGQRSRFARLMDGNSKPATRRFLQLAFNRPHSYPKVLVAQSLVGREGLNLHTACRTVVLLHLEWNPGVVEQQIGRVDRIGSLWEEKLKRWEKTYGEGGDPESIPRIEIRQVIFQGTYDEQQWAVLQARWRDLRAQLHGLILSPDLAREDAKAAVWIKKINNMAPDFSPGRTPE